MMKTKTASSSKSIEERLNDYLELKVKIQGLSSVVENAEGDLIKANAAEERVIEEIRQLGQTTIAPILVAPTPRSLPMRLRGSID